MLDMDVEISWQYFSNHVHAIINDTIPVYKVNTKKPKPSWMVKYCLNLGEEKYRAWKKYTYPRDREHYLFYFKVRNKVTRAVRFAKKWFERGISMECKDNPKSF